MPEEEPKQPEPVKPEPPPSPQGTIPSGTARQRVTQSQQHQPFLKALSVKTLRGTIHLLEGVVEKLEAEPVKPQRDVVGKVSTPTGELPPVVAIPKTPASAEVETVEVTTDVADLGLQDVTDSVSITKTSSPEAASVVEDKPFAIVKPSASEKLGFQSWWKAALQKIRSLLPEWVNQKLPDWGLTSAIAALVILLFWTTSVLLAGKSEPVAEIPVAQIETPPELVAPESPEPVKIEPPPEPVLTPEQTLIAGIQNQVAEITRQYADGLIQSIQANFQNSLLIVTVSDSWYDLSESQQDKLANEMLSQSQELDFSKLQISDSQGSLLARSPFVGGRMVILKRRVIAANS